MVIITSHRFQTRINMNPYISFEVSEVFNINIVLYIQGVPRNMVNILKYPLPQFVKLFSTAEKNKNIDL